MSLADAVSLKEDIETIREYSTGEQRSKIEDHAHQLTRPLFDR
jgi:hypothetical protein